jgi:hypothetical protein
MERKSLTMSNVREAYASWICAAGEGSAPGLEALR